MRSHAPLFAQATLRLFDMSFLAISIAIALTLWLVIKLLTRLEHKRLLIERGKMTIDEIYDAWYESSGISRADFAEIWTELASTLEMDPRILRPNDRFGVDIARPKITTDELDTLAEIAERRLKAMGSAPASLESVGTIDDYVRLVSKKG